MADVHSQAIRSYNMSRIKSGDTEPEMVVRRFVVAKGYRYRLHDKKLPGKPDIVMPKYRTVIFVHGCFWHGHADCRYFKVPKTRTKFWLEKIKGNQKRDRENFIQLKDQGWNVFSIFECELKGANSDQTLSKILGHLKKFSNAKRN